MNEEEVYLTEDEVELTNPKDVAFEVEVDLQRSRTILSSLRSDAPFKEDMEDGEPKEALLRAYKELDKLIALAADVHNVFMNVQRQ